MSQLMTNWICIATEGETVDKREMDRQWLIDAAETYDPELYTALIWPEHEECYGSAGEVLAVKAEEGDDNLVRLYASLSPSLNLLEANRRGQLLFCSVEFTQDGNFRGTGKTYLEGLGVTNTPASVGTTRLRFSKGKKGARLIGAPKPMVFDEIKEINEVKDMSKDKKKTWRNLFSIADEQDIPDTQTPADTDKLQAMAEALAALENRVSALEGKTEETAATVEEVQEDVETVKEVVDTQEFKLLRDNIGGIVKNFSKLDDRITQLPNKNPKGDARKPFKFL